MSDLTGHLEDDDTDGYRMRYRAGKRSCANCSVTTYIIVKVIFFLNLPLLLNPIKFDSIPLLMQKKKL